MKRYAVIVRRTAGGYCAHCPDVPGCVAAGDSVEDALAGYQEALRVHIEAIRSDGGPEPEPSTIAAMLEIEDVA